MEELVSKSMDYGVGALCVLLTLMVLLKVGEFLWAIREKKENVSEKAIKDLTSAVQASTVATQHLDMRLQNLEKSVAELPKVKADMHRIYSAIREVAGEDWPRIRDVILKDEFNA